MATIGYDCEVIIDSNPFWVKPLSYKVKRPRISKSQYRADGSLSYVDLGPGKREWSMIILCKNELLRYDGVATGITGEQYRTNLLNSYTSKIATTINFVDPTNTTIAVYFLNFIETILDLKSQVIPLSVGGSLGASYEIEISLLEA